MDTTSETSGYLCKDSVYLCNSSCPVPHSSMVSANFSVTEQYLWSVYYFGWCVATKQRADSYLITGIGQPLLKLGTYHIVHATSKIWKALSFAATYWVQKGSAVPECRVVDYFWPLPSYMITSCQLQTVSSSGKKSAWTVLRWCCAAFIMQLQNTWFRCDKIVSLISERSRAGPLKNANLNFEQKMKGH